MSSLIGPFGYPVQDFLRGALVFLRITGVLFMVPIFGDSVTPPRVRILLGVALTLGLYPIISTKWMPEIPSDIISTAFVVGRELFIGMVLGFVTKATFEGLVMAANLVGFQMGFGTGSLFMAESEGQINSFAALHKGIIMLIFLSLSLHHLFIQGIVDSFTLIPGGMATGGKSLYEMLIHVSSGVFVVSIQLAAPIIVALLFAMATMGLLARAVPQLNVFVLSFPASFFVGLLIYIATLPFFPNWIRDHMIAEQESIRSALLNLRPI